MAFAALAPDGRIVGPSREPAGASPQDLRAAAIIEAYTTIRTGEPLPTLVLLDADDLESDFLLNVIFSTQPAGSAASQAIDRIRVEKDVVLTFVMQQPSLKAWDWREEWSDSPQIKRNEFMIRLFSSYDLAIMLHGVDPLAPSRAGIESQLRRWLSQDNNSFRGPLTWGERLARLKADVEELYAASQTILGKAATCPGSQSDVARFLATVSRIDQFGKRPAAAITTEIDAAVAAVPKGFDLTPFRDGSYGLKRIIREQVRNSGASPNPAQQHLLAYELFRDCARWLGDGAFTWGRVWVERHKDRPFRILFIDENLGLAAMDQEAVELRRCTTRIFRLLFGDGGFEISLIDDCNGILPASAKEKEIGYSIAGIDRYLENLRGKRIAASPEGSVWTEDTSEATRTLLDFDAIFCEVDYRARFAGPQVVQKLESFFERKARAAGRRDKPAPATIVLTHMDRIGHVQQCLNLGASAFVNKERLFQIPSRLMRAIARPTSGPGEASGHPSRRRIPTENLGQHSNFRNLYALRPNRRVSLQALDSHHAIVGGWDKRAGERRTLPSWDDQDRRWIGRLPKADLHCHFGTSITLETIEALALNTCGHFFRNWTGEPADGPVLPGRGLLTAQCYELVKAVCDIVVRAAAARPAEADSTRTARVFYEQTIKQAPEEFFRQPRDKLPSYSSNPYGDARRVLMGGGPPVKEHLVTALIIVITKLLRDGPDSVLKAGTESWSYFGNIGEFCSLAIATNRDDITFVEDFIYPAARLGAIGAEAIEATIGPLVVSDYSDAEQKVFDEILITRAVANSDAIAKTTANLWRTWRGNIDRRLRAAVTTLNMHLQESLSAVDDKEPSIVAGAKKHAPSLAEMVALPPAPDTRDQSLTRYLWGCELLGADHLQYPENIILATHDLVLQNVADHVVYMEVRCETPGYTRAGMSGELVTDLLTASFDLAEIYEFRAAREQSKSGVSKSLVRTNVLLAAKRHKPAENIEPVISLLTMYLRRPRQARLFDKEASLPGWWKPTRVVGFDLSGDESRIPNPEALIQQIGRITQLSSPITIHAGEAASAESIWRAVYEYHARRIGHGLRLRERGELLQYCINEGICMEMCPISNVFTSDFIQVPSQDKYEPFHIEQYPLRHFLQSGLEVCINTDNRSLHGNYELSQDDAIFGMSLTSEYLWAARLSGGFSRWEVLKLIKAGFKHAFINKQEAHELLQAVEFWIFPLVANEPGLDWQPVDVSAASAAGANDPDEEVTHLGE